MDLEVATGVVIYGYNWGRMGRGGIAWETGTDVHTLLVLCMKQIAHENLLHARNSSQRSVVT